MSESRHASQTGIDENTTLDENTAAAELEDADFGDEAGNTTFAGEQRDRPATEPDEAEPRGRGGEGGMDQPPEDG